MKKALFLLFISCTLFTANTYAQDPAAAEALVAEGIALHDRGDYQGAIKKYDKALAADKDNAFAMSEKALTLYALEKYKDCSALCKKTIELHPGDEALESVYITYGNSLDAQGKSEESIAVYDEGIKAFPQQYQFYFNKGITLTTMKELTLSLEAFEQGAMVNPKHASSQNVIARVNHDLGNRIPAIMAYARFLAIEPEGERAEGNLANMRELMIGNVTKTGKNAVTISVNAGSLSDTAADGSNNANNFGMIELMLMMSSAVSLDKEHKNDTEVEAFKIQFEMLCSALASSKEKNSGFYWDYYTPYFIEMKEKGFTETFAYIAFSSTGDGYVKKWLKGHESEVFEFYEWSRKFDWYSSIKE